MRGQHFSPTQLETLANDLLARYERKKGSTLQSPVQADLIAENVGLNILWDEISEEPGTTVCGELVPEERLIVLNERRLALFNDTPGLYNTVVGHELGHWWLHVDHDALDHTSLPEVASSSAPSRSRDGRDRRDEQNAHRLMSYLLLPRSLLLPRLEGMKLRNWPPLYRLRDTFDVTITVMRIRLENLGLVYVDAEGRFYKSKQEAQGQSSLF